MRPTARSSGPRDWIANYVVNPSWRHLLIRDDSSGAFEPGNARWRIARWYMRRPKPDGEAVIARDDGTARRNVNEP